MNPGLKRGFCHLAGTFYERPRKTLGFETPAERFDACVAAIG
jgi:IS30 family transposase